jgi:hypothetical protein
MISLHISMYARTNRCYNERGSRNSYVRCSIPHCTCVPHYTVSCFRTLCDLNGVHVQTYILFDSVITFCIYTEIRSGIFPNLLFTKLNMLCTCAFLKIEGMKWSNLILRVVLCWLLKTAACIIWEFLHRGYKKNIICLLVLKTERISGMELL